MVSSDAVELTKLERRSLRSLGVGSQFAGESSGEVLPDQVFERGMHGTDADSFWSG